MIPDVDCIYLSPPRGDVKRWHCRYDSCEGDCHLVSCPEKKCSFQQERLEQFQDDFLVERQSSLSILKQAL